MILHVAVVILIGLSSTYAQEFDVFSTNRIGFGPQFSAKRDVRFYLFTPLTETEPHVFAIDSVGSLARSFYNRSLPVRIVIHGWMNNYTSLAIRGVKEAYLSRGEYNVIGVDWNKGASEVYFRASQYTLAVGYVVADLIDRMVEAGMATLDQIYLIGHSLGAHIAGNAGRLTSVGKLKAIFGLDPASINFFEDEPETRLSSDDAEYVEVIHTNTQFSGYPHPIGHVDLYLNYGKKQPGCLTEACSHGRSIEYFMESLSPDCKGFWGARCDEYGELKSKTCYNLKQQALLGGDPPRWENEKGIYVVVTAVESPYALGFNY
ncbi:lipase member H-like [Uranotaenia lowii]|uniref:lipase member H-like n=1 Tax=Uranotaenia lowii TaxID=190385 RepID=UPI00247A2DFB|nr:lipase member H-like [Uranotaenia lowii]XP_055596132.1 lipase member H-like [Uranotaenia lowii]XP_055596133.1 lipase member H-like [Uranotaenia lowii]XP_055596134.1 lipase member H-like [Uranotaenia lowii]XP_055596136.1 lipase member H-like [Uranotaenia lowii]